MRRMFGALMALAFVLSASAALADEFSVAEPFVKGAQIYAPGFQAFARSAALPTREDFVAEPLGNLRWPGVAAYPYRPWIVNRLKDPARFKFELQTPSCEFHAEMHAGV